MTTFPFLHFKNSTRVHCFLDLEHPAVAWAVMRGVMVSADFAYSEPFPGFVSFMQAGIIDVLNNRRLFNELLIERMRAEYYSHHVSRLRGIFFFRSRGEVERMIGDSDWPPYFTPENLVDLELYYDHQYTDVDANWITFAPTETDGRISLSDIDWIHRYWNGECYADREPVGERLANGAAVVLGEQVRTKCYRYLADLFPKASIPLLMARLAAEAGTRGGLITPFLSGGEDGFLNLDYIWSDAEFHNPEVISAIAEHPDAGALFRMISESESWQMPNFRPWMKTFRVTQQPLEGLPTLQFPRVHNS